ncbi:MAG: hypothetical protein ACJ74D_11740 [Gaiellaceae bacterium]
MIVVLVLVAATTAMAAFARAERAPTPARCGGQLWRLKTLSDVGRKAVALVPKTTTIGDIAGRPFPRPVPRIRRTAFQRQNWEVVAQITQYRLDDGGLRLILFDHGAYVNAVIPVPTCLTRTSRARTAMTGAWNTFATTCAKPARDWQSLGAIVHISGVGFWSQREGERGAAANGAELYPVTGFRIVAGCG